MSSKSSKVQVPKESSAKGSTSSAQALAMTTYDEKTDDLPYDNEGGSQGAVDVINPLFIVEPAGSTSSYAEDLKRKKELESIKADNLKVLEDNKKILEDIKKMQIDVKKRIQKEKDKINLPFKKQKITFDDSSLELQDSVDTHETENLPCIPLKTDQEIARSRELERREDARRQLALLSNLDNNHQPVDGLSLLNNCESTENLNSYFEYEHLYESTERKKLFFQLFPVHLSNLIKGNIIPIFNSTNFSKKEFSQLTIIALHQVFEENPLSV